jgi:hypothetical protein
MADTLDSGDGFRQQKAVEMGQYKGSQCTESANRIPAFVAENQGRNGRMRSVWRNQFDEYALDGRPALMPSVDGHVRDLGLAGEHDKRSRFWILKLDR